ncbi:MAG TPA: ammonia-forming cytochrome c nitrite reductase subunit c552 [Thermoanaerobaculia bacterium]|nr:ammonia-forming cytochrome c nitrite reductase subunit c552 [Thermoanaerobaculia bacterium]HQR66308.1 ammonia-forming cytochrome c nitrite reductase subunit c552 [Thermoanaerobaculia bacterium]
MSADNNAPATKRGLLVFLVAGAFALGALLAAALLLNIAQRKQEARMATVKLVPVTENDVDPAKWGTNWPREYDGYKKTSEPTHTKYGGGWGGAEGAIPPQKAVRDPWLTRIFAGYLFAVDYRDRRGHAFMLFDQENTKRNVPTEAKQSGNCLHCHASIMPLYRKLGAEAAPQASAAEQLQKGLEAVGNLGYWDAHKKLEELGGGKAHPVACVDCHDPGSMEVRVTRPAFIAGIQKLAASGAAVPYLASIERWRTGNRARSYDPNVDSTRQEKRTYVCAQCHVEYFCGKGTTVFFPWADGLKVEEIEHSYDGMVVKEKRFKDWVHAETGMEVLKAQHPEFEVWSQGIHARSGVACADCHMSYRRDGAQKISEHWVRSPLLSANRSCATCHPYSDEELMARVEAIQDRHFALMSRAGQAAVGMIDAIVAVRRPYDEKNRSAAAAKARETLEKNPDFAKLPKEEQEKKLAAETKANLLAAWREVVEKDAAIRELGELQRAAQWRLDFVAAENSMGFHAPQEMARVLGESIDLSRQAQLKASELLGGKLPAPAAVVAAKDEKKPAK